jgi:hypothetical protein
MNRRKEEEEEGDEDDRKMEVFVPHRETLRGG